jgi:hypothetical protein
MRPIRCDFIFGTLFLARRFLVFLRRLLVFLGRFLFFLGRFLVFLRRLLVFLGRFIFLFGQPFVSSRRFLCYFICICFTRRFFLFLVGYGHVNRTTNQSFHSFFHGISFLEWFFLIDGHFDALHQVKQFSSIIRIRYSQCFKVIDIQLG